MAEKTTYDPFTSEPIYWVCRFGSWLGYSEPVTWRDHPDGGGYVNAAGEWATLVVANGFAEPASV